MRCIITASMEHDGGCAQMHDKDGLQKPCVLFGVIGIGPVHDAKNGCRKKKARKKRKKRTVGDNCSCVGLWAVISSSATGTAMGLCTCGCES